jgi:polysaccharide pyruvyl transferase WcaK-like protein
MKDRPSILLLSGWNFYNIGDVSHTPGFIQLANEVIPEAEITVLAASYPEELGRYLDRFHPGTSVVPMEFESGTDLSQGLLRRFDEADLFVVNAGMTLSFGYRGLSWDRYMPKVAALMKARSDGIPFGIWAHSFDTMAPHADIILGDILRDASFLFTRDTDSLDLLDSHGVRAREMGFVPDSAFAFKRTSPETVKAFLGEHSLERDAFLIVVPRLDVDRFRDDDRYLVHAEQTQRWLTHWVETTGKRAMILHEREDGIQRAHDLVYNALGSDVRQMVAFQPTYWMPDQCQYAFERAAVVLSAEMHSVIMALAIGTPAIHTFFKEAGLKQGMMTDIGLDEWLVDQDESADGEIENLIVGIAENPAAATQAVNSAMSLVNELQAKRMKFLGEVMATSQRRQD